MSSRQERHHRWSLYLAASVIVRLRTEKKDEEIAKLNTKFTDKEKEVEKLTRDMNQNVKR